MTLRVTSRAPALLVLACGFCICLVAACAQTGAQTERDPLPTVIPAGDLTAPPAPTDERQLLIVTLLTRSREDGSIESTALVRAQVLRSYPPNAFGRRGSWTVRLRTDGAGTCGDEEVVCYGIDDPRLIEIETTGGEQPYTYVLEPEIEWQLFVPLYDRGSELGVNGIDVLDENSAIVTSLGYDADTDNVVVRASPTPEPTATPANTPPTVTIIRPAADSTGAEQQYAYTGFDEARNMWYTDVGFFAQAEDNEDAVLMGRALVWTTDRTDLQPATLGAGASLSVRLFSNNCEGVVHRVTVTATDSAGDTATATRTIGIWTFC